MSRELEDWELEDWEVVEETMIVHTRGVRGKDWLWASMCGQLTGLPSTSRVFGRLSSATCRSCLGAELTWAQTYSDLAHQTYSARVQQRIKGLTGG